MEPPVSRLTAPELTVPEPAGPDLLIGREVVAAIGAHAAAGTPGVVRLEDSLTGLLGSLSRSARQRIIGITPAPVAGTSATVADGLARVRVEVAVSAERPVIDTVADIQRSVARAVAAGTGLIVGGVSVTVLDVVLPGRAAGLALSPDLELSPGLDRDYAGAAGGLAASGAELAGTADEEPGPAEALGAPSGGADPLDGSRAQVTAAVLRAVRSVPGLRPASPVLTERPRWLSWDPGVLAVRLDGDGLEVQLAATRLPLPALLADAAAAVQQATAGSRWAALPVCLLVTALDAGALSGPAGDFFAAPP